VTQAGGQVHEIGAVPAMVSLRMLRRMRKVRMTVSLDPTVVARVRQCGARTRGGASGYLERLVRQDELREAVQQHGQWFRDHPGYVELSIEEAAAARDAERSA
jgi:hypothetical protein